ncbi:DNA translocase FtsK [Oscillospiraceae bacterium NSJ-54]|uniref:DNA translocase FtsK n=2 Tax=Zongyangia hominis TaxID=2763677 RepID=A0A926I7C8_9FIRM|nr:DNA translocase FtsK [Zongyangia hominis]
MPLTSLLGSVGAGIVIVLLIFVFLMIFTGFTLIDLFQTAAKPVKRMEQVYIEKAQEKEERAAQASFNIDVPLDKESKFMPAHPVEAPKGTGAAAMSPEEEQAWAEAELLKQQAQATAKKLRESEQIREEANKKPMELVEELPPIKAPDPVEILDGPEEEPAAVSAIPPFAVEDAPPVIQTDSPKEEGFQFDFGGAVTEAPQVHPRPPLSLLKEPGPARTGDENEQQNGEILIETLKSFGVRASIIDIARGPAVTRYELQPAAGVKISKITNLADDIALNLAAAGVRIEAPIPGKPAVGIEVPNKNVGLVGIREIIDSKEFEQSKSKLTVALGKDVSGNIAVADIGKMPHMLIAGATGSGKSVCINSIIISLLYKATPDEVKLLMVDPKVVELGVYNGIPNLLVPVVTDPRKAAGALNWAVNEMLNRYKLFADNGVRDLKGFNKLANSKEEEALKPLPEIVIIIDELADLMMAAPNEVEDAICRLAQMARAAGMHLVIATQRPSVDVITGVIKANIPSRIAFAVSSQVDSRTILDMGGAEKLLGRGDMLFYPVGMPKPLRVQGCYVSDSEVERVVAFVKEAQDADYDEDVMEEIEKQAVAEKGSGGDGGGFSDEDEMLPKAIECVIEAGQASTSLLQRRLKLGYARAARLVDEMEQRGVVGPFEGSKPRQVLMTRQQWIEMNMQKDE